MIQTFSEAVASLTPWLLKAIAASGLSWAGIIVTARCEITKQTNCIFIHHFCKIKTAYCINKKENGWSYQLSAKQNLFYQLIDHTSF